MAAPTVLTERHFGISFADQQQHQHQQQQTHHHPLPFYHPISNSSSTSSLQQQQEVPTVTTTAPSRDFVPPYQNVGRTNHSYRYNNNSLPRKMSQGSRSTSPASHGSSSQAHHQTKTGRKGDPRMHRAVAARLNDPNMTLFEALKAGGFDYPDDNNPSYVDSEKITLAQRKNQLSRRLRIARRSDNVNKYPAPSPTDNQNKLESLMEKQKESFQMMQQTMELERRTSSQLNGATGLKRARSASHNDGAASKSPGKGGKSLLDEDDVVEVDEEQDKKQPSQMMAKFHPQFQQLLVQPQMQFGGHPGPFPGMAAAAPNQAPFGMNQGMGMFYHNAAGGFTMPNMAPVATGDTPNSAATSAGTSNPSSGGAAQSNISGVALRSLTNTAQSVGLSLEQLALALSSTRNLAHIVLGDDDDKNPGSAAEQKKKKQDLALQMYHHEVRPVYSRCMLLAGYKPEMTAQNSKEFLKFAWKAWQKEGRYLRDLLEENDMLVADAPDFHTDDSERPAKKRKAAAEETEEGEEPNKDEDKAEDQGHHPHSHSHGNSPGCHTADGRHIHRLEKCGHKAILHQPKDGEAHIDFVVGDKVECYAGVTGQESSTWQSLYPCDQCDRKDSAATSEISDVEQSSPKPNGPKVLDLKELDLHGNDEWNMDFDQTIGGLVRLGEINDSLRPRSDSEGFV